MQRVELTVPLPDWYEVPAEGDPLSIPALGIAYRVLNQVEAVEPGSLAAQSGRLQRGHEITRIQFLQPDDRQSRARATLTGQLNYALGVNNPNWPFAEAFILQHVLPGTKVLLTIKGQEDNPVELEPEESLEWHTVYRGLRLQPLTETEIAESFGDALRLGLRETGESLTLVFEFLRRITYLWKGMGGPISIVRLAGESASSGLAQLLIFLAMLSANLAVINALPIPVLDGGHFLFLALEGIRGKPVSERLFVLFTYLGFVFILGLMILAITLDIIRL
jgi:regulator of sigma E protease